VWQIGAKHPMLQLKRLFFVTKKTFFLLTPSKDSRGVSFTTCSWPLFCCNSKGGFSRTFHGMFFYHRFQIVAIFLPLLHVFLLVFLNTCPAELSSLSERFVWGVPWSMYLGILSMGRGPPLVALALYKVIRILSDAVTPDCSFP